jgi:hypothetical protein
MTQASVGESSVPGISILGRVRDLLEKLRRRELLGTGRLGDRLGGLRGRAGGHERSDGVALGQG